MERREVLRLLRGGREAARARRRDLLSELKTTLPTGTFRHRRNAVDSDRRSMARSPFDER